MCCAACLSEESGLLARISGVSAGKSATLRNVVCSGTVLIWTHAIRVLSMETVYLFVDQYDDGMPIWDADCRHLHRFALRHRSCYGWLLRFKI